MFTGKQFEEFRKETEAALSDIAKKYNVDIKAGKINYSSDDFRLEMTVSKKTIGGKDFQLVQFEKNCTYYGLKPEDYNRSFVADGKVLRITGFNPRARVKPILAMDDCGRTYSVRVEVMKRILSNQSGNTGIPIPKKPEPEKPVKDLFEL